jgi:hypothetical protein
MVLMKYQKGTRTIVSDRIDRYELTVSEVNAHKMELYVPDLAV